MTADEARKMLAHLPGNAQFCFRDGLEIFEISQIGMVPVTAYGRRYAAQEVGGITVAVVA